MSFPFLMHAFQHHNKTPSEMSSLFYSYVEDLNNNANNVVRKIQGIKKEECTTFRGGWGPYRPDLYLEKILDFQEELMSPVHDSRLSYIEEEILEVYRIFVQLWAKIQIQDVTSEPKQECEGVFLVPEGVF